MRKMECKNRSNLNNSIVSNTHSVCIHIEITIEITVCSNLY